MNILHIESSLFAENGVSSQLARQLIEQFRQSQDDVNVRVKPFATEPVPHFDGEVLGALMSDAAERSPAQQQRVDYADQQIADLQWADTLVIGLPMYNFSVPSMLKAWFDYVARAGVTFRYTEQGPEGLLRNKKAYVIATRGGHHQGTESDSQTPFMKTFLGFIGIDDVEFIYVEGLNMGEEPKQRAIEQAQQHILQVA